MITSSNEKIYTIARSLRRLTVAVLSCLGFVGGVVAFPQVTMAQEPTPPAWTKLCNTDPEAPVRGCVITQRLIGQDGQPLAAVTVQEIEGADEKKFMVAVPPGLLLRPGMEIQIDDDTKYPVAYTICFPNACFGEEAIGADFITKLKKGSDLKLRAINQQGKPITFTLTLVGFTKAYDGKPVDVKKLQKQQQELQSELERKVREEREKLLNQQNNQ